MWVQIPKELVEAELNGKVPQDSTLAYAAFMMMESLTMLDGLPSDALETADELVHTGQTVTEDGEIVSVLQSLTDARSQSLASVPLESGWQTPTYEKFKTIWPDQVGPDTALLNQIMDAAQYDESLVDDVLTMLDASTTPIQTPPVLALWILKNREARFIRESAEIVRRKVDDTTFIQRALREADRKMREAEKPAVTPEHIARLQALKDKLRG